MNEFWSLLQRIPWYAWIAIVALLGTTVTRVTRLTHRHEERMAMIKQGLDPDR